MKTDALLLKKTIVYDWWGLLTTKMNNWTLSHAIPLVIIIAYCSIYNQLCIWKTENSFSPNVSLIHGSITLQTHIRQGYSVSCLRKKEVGWTTPPKTVTYNGLPAVYFSSIFWQRRLQYKYQSSTMPPISFSS